MTDHEEIVIEPQPGFQSAVLSCEADVAIIGGSAGCGKTWTLLLDPVRDLHVKGFYGVVFRRENVQIYNPGGLWDKGQELYLNLPHPLIGHPNSKPATFRFPTGSKIVFAHLNQTKDVRKYQGSEIPYIAFDELTHFDQYQFIYMLSRNRTTCGVPPRIRASCNPQGEGWVKDMISWWLYPDDYPDESLQALPRPDRRGVLRYFAVYENEFIFGDTRDEVYQQLPAKMQGMISPETIRSMTFIGGLLPDNQILMKSDPGYVGNLMAQEESDRVQLLEGRWKTVNLDERRLYNDAELYDMFTNTFVERGVDRYLTADVALEGADLFVVGIWEGWVLTKVYEYEKLAPEEVEPMIERHCRENRIPQSNVALDVNGIGAMLMAKFPNAFPVVAQATPLPDVAETGRRDESNRRPNYQNLKAQLYWKFKQVLADREIYCAVRDVVLRQRIIEELKAVRKLTRPNGKLDIEDIKQVLKRSPDRATMLTMRMVFTLIKPVKKRFKRKVKSF